MDDIIDHSGHPAHNIHVTGTLLEALHVQRNHGQAGEGCLQDRVDYCQEFIWNQTFNSPGKRLFM